MSLERLSRLRAGMAAAGLDLLALIPGASLRYFTGLGFHPGKRLTLALLPADDGPAALVVPTLEVNSIQGKVPFPAELFTWSDAEGPAAAVSAALTALKQTGSLTERAIQLGLEPVSLRVMELRALETAAGALGHAVVTSDASQLIADLRMVKGPDEIAAMREAVRVIETALQRTIDQIRPGVTEKELARFCTDAIYAAGGEGTSFDSFVGAGPNSANCHHESGDRPLKAGDLIIIDCGAVARGYASDITRTVALGEPGSEARLIYNTVLAANAAGRAAVRPNVTGEEIDAAARGVIELAGYGQFFPHRTGHGLGIDVHPCHEAPDLVAGSRRPLAIGTTFTIEPGIYLPGLGGVRIEDDMVINAHGGESLTTFERDLLVIPA